MINIILADDHQIVREGLISLLDDAPMIMCHGEAKNGQEALDLLVKHKGIDIAVLDIEMPVMDGVEATRQIKAKYPEVKVLILTMYTKHEFITSLIKEGASGYILKERGREELINAIQAVYRGEHYFGERVTSKLIEGMRQRPRPSEQEKIVKLTKREKEVLKLIAEGMTTPQISARLFIAHSTVETHRRNLIDKLDVPNSKGLVAYAVKHQII